MVGPVAQIKVYVADDHPLYRASATRAVRQHRRMELAGEAADGWTAMDDIVATVPQVALVDIVMPDLDGMQVLAAIGSRAIDPA
jgi:two-component system nitrate/nitrite response regulator NarL